MADIIIIHGAYGSPEENWVPWLRQRLESQGNRVFVPGFPTPEDQTLENWLAVFDDYAGYMGEDTILIGHSLGAAFILTVLEKHPAKAAFLVAGFAQPLGIRRFDCINRTFVEKDFDWKDIKDNCSNFCLLHSDDDPYVSLEKAKFLADKLGKKLIVVEGAGHFNKNSGYERFDLLLGMVKSL
ncbi:serine hydrolase family protein [Candidatus Woesearchaeota archaeon]|nr:serine hydrolase family protein [Candidatus Woesearchaeota archaeon]